MEMEKSFQERNALEQEFFAQASTVERESKKAMLEKMASTFSPTSTTHGAVFEEGRATGTAV